MKSGDIVELRDRDGMRVGSILIEEERSGAFCGKFSPGEHFEQFRPTFEEFADSVNALHFAGLGELWAAIAAFGIKGESSEGCLGIHDVQIFAREGVGSFRLSSNYPSYGDDSVQQELLRFANSLPPALQSSQSDDWDRFKEFIRALVSRGWSRGDVYNAVLECLFVNRGRLSESGDDALSNYLTSLAGHCHPDCLARFPNEPEDPQEFIEYVRGLTWMRKKGEQSE